MLGVELSYIYQFVSQFAHKKNMWHSLIIVAEITFKIKSNIIKLKTLEFYVCVPNVAYHDPLTEIGGSIFENSKILYN